MYSISAVRLLKYWVLLYIYICATWHISNNARRVRALLQLRTLTPVKCSVCRVPYALGVWTVRTELCRMPLKAIGTNQSNCTPAVSRRFVRLMPPCYLSHSYIFTQQHTKAHLCHIQWQLENVQGRSSCSTMQLLHHNQTRTHWMNSTITLTDASS